MRKILIGLILATLYFTPYTIFSQVTYKDQNASAVAVQRLLVNTSTGTSQLGLVTANDTVWLVADAGALDIQLDGSVSINGTPIGSGGADSLYVKYVTTAADTASAWKLNGDTLLIPVIAGGVNSADSLYVKYVTTAADTATEWKLNGDTIFIPVTEAGADYSWTYKQGSSEIEITDGDATEFVGGDGINLYSRSLAAGGAQLTMVASQPDQWFDYQVIWVSGWTYYISSGYFFKNGEYYSTSDTTITLDAADATHPRIDVFAVDTNETVVKITGTPAADPVMPTVDPESQLFLTFRYVQAGATEPTIDTDLVYDENEEWTTSSSATTDVTVDFANATSPQNGDSCIYISHDTGGSISGANMTFTAAANDTTDGQSLTFYMRSSDAWSRGTRMGIFLLNGTTTIGAKTLNRMGDMYGFDDTDDSWQRISINLDDFNLTNNIFNKITIRAYTFPTGNILSFDYIELQGTSDPPATGYNLLTQNNTTRTSLSIPLDNAVYISASGLYNVGKNTSNVPTGVEGTIFAMYNSTATDGLLFMLVDEDSGDVYTSVDKGANWTEIGGAAGASQLSDLSDVNTSTATSGNIFVADGTDWESVSASGDVTLSGAGAFTIGANAIEESMLKAVNAPTDEFVLTYESTTGDFEWEIMGAGSAFINPGADDGQLIFWNNSLNRYDTIPKLHGLWDTSNERLNFGGGTGVNQAYLRGTASSMVFNSGYTHHFYIDNAQAYSLSKTNFTTSIANTSLGTNTYKWGDFYSNYITADDNVVTIYNDLVIPTPTVPSSKTDTGTPGQIAWDANYFYWCVSTNVWERAPKDPTW